MMIDERDTFNFIPFNGYYVTLRHGVFVGYVCLVNERGIGGGKYTGKRVAKFQGDRDDVLQRAIDWIKSQ